MGLKPQYRITANDKDISKVIEERLKSLQLTDAVGLESDSLEIVLADDGIKTPPTGAELRVYLGYDNHLQHMGLFVVDEIEYQGWPATLVIRARAAVHDRTPKGKKSLRSQQNREWAKDTTLGALVQKIAGDHGMTAAVGQDLLGVKIPHTLQTDESDLHFLTRLGKKYDAVVKPAAGKIIFSKIGTGKSVSGLQLQAVAIKAHVNCTSFRMTQAKRDQAGTVVAYYHNKGEAKRHEVQVGSGEEPIRRLRMQYSTKAEAVAAAKAEFDRLERKKTTLNVRIVGNPNVQAEAPLTLEGFREGVDGADWIITRAQHSLDGSGFVTEIEAEKKSSTDQKDVGDVGES